MSKASEQYEVLKRLIALEEKAKDRYLDAVSFDVLLEGLSEREQDEYKKLYKKYYKKEYE